MNHIHNIDLISKVVIGQFDGLKNKYGFKDYESKKGTDSINISIGLNDVIIEAYINEREGVRILYRKRSWPEFKKRDFMSFLGLKFNNDFEKEEQFLRDFLTPRVKLEDFSYEFYEHFLSKELEFVEKNFPGVFTKGVLDGFEK